MAGGGALRPEHAAGLELSEALDAQLRAGHADADAFVERAFDLDARAGLLVDAPEQRVALAVVGLELPHPALEVAEVERAGQLHRSGSRARSPRPANHAAPALASSQKGMNVP